MLENKIINFTIISNNDEEKKLLINAFFILSELIIEYSPEVFENLPNTLIIQWTYQHNNTKKEQYILNFINNPEIKSLFSIEVVLFLFDLNKEMNEKILLNYNKILEPNVLIIPVLNQSEVQNEHEIMQNLNLDINLLCKISLSNHQGIKELLDMIVKSGVKFKETETQNPTNLYKKFLNYKKLLNIITELKKEDQLLLKYQKLNKNDKKTLCFIGKTPHFYSKNENKFTQNLSLRNYLFIIIFILIFFFNYLFISIFSPFILFCFDIIIFIFPWVLLHS